MIEEKLEIVIPTYNRGNYLDKTLNSLFPKYNNAVKYTF